MKIMKTKPDMAYTTENDAYKSTKCIMLLITLLTRDNIIFMFEIRRINSNFSAVLCMSLHIASRVRSESNLLSQRIRKS